MGNENLESFMGRGFGYIFAYFSALWFYTAAGLVPVHAATVAEVAARIKSLKAQERIAYLLKGAQAEGELA